MPTDDRTRRTVDLDYNRAVKAQNRREAKRETSSVDQRAFDIDEDRFGPQDA
jgi:hypothetical protein